VSTFHATLERRGRGARPSYTHVLLGTIYGQVAGSILLWATVFVLTSLQLLGASKHGTTAIYLPWQLRGTWSIVATLGWGTLVAALMGSWVRLGVAGRTGVAPAWGWCVLSVAVGGYTSMLLTETTGALVLLAVVLTSTLVTVLAFESSGAARPFPGTQALPHAGWIGLLATLTVLLATPYSLLHPFVGSGSALEGSAGRAGSLGRYSVKVGHAVRVIEGLSDGLLGVTITGVRLLASTTALRTSGVVVTPDSPSSGTSRLPIALRAGQELWIASSATLARCVTPAARIDNARVDYRIWGLALSETVPLEAPIVASCTAN
jgi:hypothetical protein